MDAIEETCRREPVGSALEEDLERVPVIDLVNRISAGELEADSLSAEVRRRCVSHLTLNGFSATETAALMRVCERTVRRDRAAIRTQGAMEPTLTLADELLGEFQRLTLASVERLTRLAADPSSPAYARLWAEDAIGRLYQRFFDTVRKMRYLHSGSHRLNQLAQTEPGEVKRQQAILSAFLAQGDHLLQNGLGKAAQGATRGGKGGGGKGG